MRAPTTLVHRLHDAGFPIGPTPDQDCANCGHLWGNHLLIASNTKDPVDGGHVDCPYQDCQCELGWGLTEQQREQAVQARREGRS